MTNIDISLLRRCLLTSGGSNAIDELLRNVTIEELVMHMSSMDDGCFLLDDDSQMATAVNDERYIGSILVRVMDLILTKPRLDFLFQNREVLNLLSQRVLTACLPVRRLFAKKCKSYYNQGGIYQEKVEDLLWQLLLDDDCGVFEHASHALCTVTKNRDVVNVDIKVDALLSHLKSKEDPDGVIRVRLFEICAKLGAISEEAFKGLFTGGVYSEFFSLYMKSDFLVQLNFLEILEASPELFRRLNQNGGIPQDFINHALSVLTNEDTSPTDELLVPFMFKLLVSMLGHGILGSTQKALLMEYSSKEIMSSNPQRDDKNTCMVLGCFGLLYLTEKIPTNVSEKMEDVVQLTTREEILSAILHSLMHISTSDLNKGRLEFLTAMTGHVIRALGRFPLSEVREQAYLYLIKVIRFKPILEIVLKEEADKGLFSSQENLYATTVAKKSLVREVMRSIEETYGNPAGPLSRENIEALKRYTTKG